MAQKIMKNYAVQLHSSRGTRFIYQKATSLENAKKLAQKKYPGEMVVSTKK